ncbi:hypothetical protein Nepgr_031213 [Nepenthes gracilis]|uniref:Uncharacterized protein n=1 Tax=Nepenthes gracilis TaxID=150966 RepID=A0AAD3Y6L2_NEPGR|nr:hypothetical protein Nepgr_031213 [Nepenthes gracilis]
MYNFFRTCSLIWFCRYGFFCGWWYECAYEICTFHLKGILGMSVSKESPCADGSFHRTNLLPDHNIEVHPEAISWNEGVMVVGAHQRDLVQRILFIRQLYLFATGFRLHFLALVLLAHLLDL